jgi:hypothetical protein
MLGRSRDVGFLPRIRNLKYQIAARLLVGVSRITDIGDEIYFGRHADRPGNFPVWSRRILKSVERVRQDGFVAGAWDNAISWCNAALDEVWAEGPGPCRSVALCRIDFARVVRSRASRTRTVSRNPFSPALDNPRLDHRI